MKNIVNVEEGAEDEEHCERRRGAREMKHLILDTDIGGDCDDAGACLVLKTLALRGEIRLLGVTSCTTRAGAPHCIEAIFSHYGMRPPVGMRKGESFMEDSDTYAKRFLPQAGAGDYPEAVSLLRKLLSEAREPVTVVGIGPQRNLAALLASGGDERSPSNGEELVRQKVAELVVMGGCFSNAEKRVLYRNSVEIFAEYNVEQDIAAARSVAEHWPSPVVWVPFELGHEIFTGQRIPSESPAKLCYDLTFGVRESWDPCACLYACSGVGDNFSLGPRGTVTVDESGVTRFLPDRRGGHRILTARRDAGDIASALNELMF